MRDRHWTVRSPVFPAHAGMSLEITGLESGIVGFPRPRGDEPVKAAAAVFQTEFSPPTRG